MFSTFVFKLNIIYDNTRQQYEQLHFALEYILLDKICFFQVEAHFSNLIKFLNVLQNTML
jgi:hypothetical protein